MRKKIITHISIILISAIFCLLCYKTGIYLIDNKEEYHRIEGLKKLNISGVIGVNLYVSEEQSYDYLTYQLDFVFGKYFFANKNILNLQEGDSIYQVPGKLLLEIYKKDEKGNYVFDRLSQ